MKTYNVDTSINGFKYVGINLTDKQYKDLCDLNLLLIGDNRKDIPVFNIIMVLKVLGLLPSEMINEESNNQCNDNIDNDIQHKFGKIIKKSMKKRRLFTRRKT